jgi:hypothetical protein
MASVSSLLEMDYLDSPPPTRASLVPPHGVANYNGATYVHPVQSSQVAPPHTSMFNFGSIFSNNYPSPYDSFVPYNPEQQEPNTEPNTGVRKPTEETQNLLSLCTFSLLILITRSSTL